MGVVIGTRPSLTQKRNTTTPPPLPCCHSVRDSRGCVVVLFFLCRERLGTRLAAPRPRLPPGARPSGRREATRVHRAAVDFLYYYYRRADSRIDVSLPLAANRLGGALPPQPPRREKGHECRELAWRLY